MNNYPILRLGDIVKPVQERMADRTKWHFDKYIAGEHIDSGEVRIEKCGKIKGNEEVIGSAFHMCFKPGHVLYSTRRAYLRKAGIVNFEGICSNVTLVLQANEEKLLQSLLPFVLQSESFVQFAISRSIGSTNPFVKWTDLSKYRLRVPPISIQKEISQILWAVEDNVEKIENLIQVAEKLKKDLLEELLTKGIGHKKFKKTELGEIPADWFVQKLSDACEIIMGQSPPSSSYNSINKGLPFIQGKADFGEKYPSITIYTDSETKLAKSGDILFTVRAPVGAMNWCDKETCIGRGVAAFRPRKNTNNLFLYYTLERLNYELNRLSQGSTFTAINGKELKGFKITRLPLEEQEKIGKILNECDEEISRCKMHLSNIVALKKKLTNSMISGELHIQKEDIN